MRVFPLCHPRVEAASPYTSYAPDANGPMQCRKSLARGLILHGPPDRSDNDQRLVSAIKLNRRRPVRVTRGLETNSRKNTPSPVRLAPSSQGSQVLCQRAETRASWGNPELVWE